MVLCTGQTCQSFFKKILKWKDVSALTTSLSLATSKNLGPGKNEHEHEPVWKTRPQGLKDLPFVSSHMKDNVKVNYVYTKSRDVRGLVFVQITFEKCWTYYGCPFVAKFNHCNFWFDLIFFIQFDLFLLIQCNHVVIFDLI